MDTESRQLTIDQAGPVINDFKTIRGIGASVEDRLHKAGILTYRQLAELSPQELSDVLKGVVGLTPERITAQDWIGQAMQLASEMAAPGSEGEAPELQKGQHYAVFTLELLLDAENHVRRTRVMHVQSQIDVTWAGWDEKHLMDFFVAQAPLVRPGEGEPAAVIQSGPVELPASAFEPVAESALPAETTGLAGQFRIQSLEPKYTGSGAATRLIPSGQPFNLRLQLDLAKLDAPPDLPIYYTVSLHARRVGADNGRQLLGTARGAFMRADNTIIEVGVSKLASGSYRVDAIVVLSLSDQEPQAGPGTMAMLEGGLFQVY